MISAQETVILFVSVVVLASLVVFTLGSQVKTSLGKLKDVSSSVSSSISSDFDIISVSESSNTTVVLKGISGEINVSSLVVLADGAPASVISGTFLRDSDSDGTLDPGDTYSLTINGAGYTCIVVDSPESRALWGRCT